MNNVQSPNRLPTARILRTWWPLAGSWLLMTTELPLISAVIARLVEPEINLAAWGIIFAVSTIVQSPSTMLLAASTALSTDWESYRRLRRYMLITVTILTGLHILIAFTPLSGRRAPPFAVFSRACSFGLTTPAPSFGGRLFG